MSTLVNTGLLCFRGKRAGKKVRYHLLQKRKVTLTAVADDHIPVITVTATHPIVYSNSYLIYHGVRQERKPVRKTVRRFCQSLPQSTSLPFGSFKAQSIRNTFTSISQWITDNQLMLAAVTETWHNASDDPNLIACTPIDYCCIDRARPRQVNQIGSNHGGVCLFHHRSFRVRPLPLPNYDRFEYISNYIQGRGINLIVIVIYRPGSEHITDAFIDELADLL